MPEVQEKVKGPAIGLIVLGVLGLLAALFSLLNHVIGFGLNQQLAEQQAQMPEWARYLTGGGGMAIGIVFALLGGAGAAFVLWAGLQMLKFKSHTACMIASVVVMIPCFTSCCCIIGIGIGIWSLIVLNKPEVRSAFTATT